MPKAANNISTTKCILFANIGQKTAVKCTHEYMKEKSLQKQIKERKKKTSPGPKYISKYIIHNY